MAESIRFFLASKVSVKGNSRKIVKFGKRFSLIGGDKARAAEQTLVARLLEHRPPEPFTGPVRLDVAFVRKIPDGWPQWKRAAALDGSFWPITRPDRGNALKLIEDAMSGLFYADDAQVVDGSVTKRYGSAEGYQIVLTPLDQATRPVLERCARPGCKKRCDHATSHYCSVACQEADEPKEAAP